MKIQYNPNIEQQTPDGRKFRYVGNEKLTDTQKWIDGESRHHFLIEVYLIETKEYKKFEVDHFDKPVKK